MRSGYSPRFFEQAIAELRKGPTVNDARERLAKWWGTPITITALCHAFQRAGRGRPSDYLNTPAPVAASAAVWTAEEAHHATPAATGAWGPEDARVAAEIRAGVLSVQRKPLVDLGSFQERSGVLSSPDERIAQALRDGAAFGRGAVDLAHDTERPPVPDEIQDPVDILREKRSKRDLKREFEHLSELLRVEREKTAYLRTLASHTAPPRILRREKASGIREATALLLASDWHPEERVEPVKVQGKNEYNLVIADQRIKRFFQGAIDLVQHHRASGRIMIRDVILALMGDLITGYIHEELIMTNELTPIETILWLMPRIRDGIATMLAELDLVSLTIPCDVGNHGRTTKYRLISMGPETSFEWGLYCQLAREFKDDPRVHFDTTPANDHYVQVYDFTLHTTHGDSVNYWGGVGGLTIPLNKAIAAWNTDIRADWHALGHFHTSIDLGNAIVNGSLIGWSPFAKWIKASYNERDLSQHFSLIDSKRGRCHSTQIWVDKRREVA